MKFTKSGLVALGIVTASIFAFRAVDNGTVKGTVNPPDGATRAWLLSSTDTLRTEINQGAFEIKDVKPGTYRVIIEAKPPYKNIAKDGVTVTDGQTSDVGEIKLSQ